MTQETTCSHLQSAGDPAPKTPDGCQECLADGSTWVSLRPCLDCGHVGCCDSSPNHHATKHFEATEHPVMRSFMPGQNWRWCLIDRVMG